MVSSSTPTRIVSLIVAIVAIGLSSCSDNVNRSGEGDAWTVDQDGGVEQDVESPWHDGFCDDPPAAVPLV